jgi:hypothetical protein
VQTTGEISPPDAVIEACDQLIVKLQKLNASLVSQVQLFRGSAAAGAPMQIGSGMMMGGDHLQMMMH